MQRSRTDSDSSRRRDRGFPRVAHDRCTRSDGAPEAPAGFDNKTDARFVTQAEYDRSYGPSVRRTRRRSQGPWAGLQRAELRRVPPEPGDRRRQSDRGTACGPQRRRWQFRRRARWIADQRSRDSRRISRSACRRRQRPNAADVDERHGHRLRRGDQLEHACGIANAQPGQSGGADQRPGDFGAGRSRRPARRGSDVSAGRIRMPACCRSPLTRT